MVRDLCQGGHGVAVVVGRAGTGKTFALGIARHAWQLDGHRLLAAAPTGIATMSLQARGSRTWPPATASSATWIAAASSWTPARCWWWTRPVWWAAASWPASLSMPRRRGPRWSLVGDDRQLAAIDASGGFRALRLRLGASELAENRRQQQAWEREALELVRSGLVEEAVAALPGP
jgi:ATP-dependent exoDNAse (exonuclease V) alpha subunit